MSDREGTGEAARTPPPELDVVQRWFQSVISHPGGVDAGVEGDEAQRLIPLGRGDLERIVMRSEKLDARERMNVYANAYYARLLECVGECFPVLKHTLGGAAFDKLAFAYLEAYPSRSYTLNHIADHFVRFLDETRPDRDRETGDVEGGDVEGGGWPDLLIDLARLEWTIGDVFDGPGSERSGTLEPADLESISADDWPRCRLELVPCLRLLEFRYPVNEYYTGVRKALARRAEEAAETETDGDRDDVPLPDAGRQYAAINRRDYVVQRFTLQETQYVLLRALESGDTVGESIQLAVAASDRDTDKLAGALRDWFHTFTSEGFFQTVHFPGAR